MRKQFMSDLLKMLGSSLIAAVVTVFCAGRWVGVSEATVNKVVEGNTKNAADIALLQKENIDLKELVIRIDQRLIEGQNNQTRLNRLVDDGQKGDESRSAENAKAHEQILVKLAAIQAKLEK